MTFAMNITAELKTADASRVSDYRVSVCPVDAKGVTQDPLFRVSRVAPLEKVVASVQSYARLRSQLTDSVYVLIVEDLSPPETLDEEGPASLSRHSIRVTRGDLLEMAA